MSYCFPPRANNPRPLYVPHNASPVGVAFRLMALWTRPASRHDLSAGERGSKRFRERWPSAAGSVTSVSSLRSRAGPQHPAGCQLRFLRGQRSRVALRCRHGILCQGADQRRSEQEETEFYGSYSLAAVARRPRTLGPTLRSRTWRGFLLGLLTTPARDPCGAPQLHEFLMRSLCSSHDRPFDVSLSE
jgi:hypothetical protein